MLRHCCLIEPKSAELLCIESINTILVDASVSNENMSLTEDIDIYVMLL